MLYKLTFKDGYLERYEHTYSEEDTYELNPLTMELEYLNCYKMVDNVLVLDEEKKDSIIREEEIKEEETKLKDDKLEMLSNMLLITREPSDKLGFDWEIYTLGNIELRREYVENGSHSGTIDDPIPFELGLSLIPNAYYLYEGKRWVYMGQGGVVAEDYPVDDVNGWVLWDID